MVQQLPLGWVCPWVQIHDTALIITFASKKKKEYDHWFLQIQVSTLHGHIDNFLLLHKKKNKFILQNFT